MSYHEMAKKLLDDMDLTFDSESDSDLPPVLYPEISLPTNDRNQVSSYSSINNNLIIPSSERYALKPSITDVERRIEEIQTLVSDIKREIKLSNKQKHEQALCERGTCGSCGGYTTINASQYGLNNKKSVSSNDNYESENNDSENSNSPEPDTRPKRACSKRIIVIDSDSDDDESFMYQRMLSEPTMLNSVRARRRNEMLMKQCKPCSVVLVDFVHHALDVERILRKSTITGINGTSSAKNGDKEAIAKKNCKGTEKYKTTATRKRRLNRSGFPSVKKNKSTYYQCLVCKFLTPYRFVILEHTYTHLNIFPFSCGRCNQMFTTKVSCNIHIKMQHKGTRTACIKTVNIDEKEYYEVKTKPKVKSPIKKKPQQTIKQMISNRISSENPIYIENDTIPLGDVEPSAAHCNDDVTVDDSPTRFRCRFCHFKSTFKHIMDDHFNKNHAEEHKYVCHLCDMAFCRKKDTMIKHFKRWHPGNEAVLTKVPGYVDTLERNYFSNNGSAKRYSNSQENRPPPISVNQNNDKLPPAVAIVNEIIQQELDKENSQEAQTEPQNLSTKINNTNTDEVRHITPEPSPQQEVGIHDTEVDILDLSMKVVNVAQSPVAMSRTYETDAAVSSSNELQIPINSTRTITSSIYENISPALPVVQNGPQNLSIIALSTASQTSPVIRNLTIQSSTHNISTREHAEPPIILGHQELGRPSGVFRPVAQTATTYSTAQNIRQQMHSDQYNLQQKSPATVSQNIGQPSTSISESSEILQMANRIQYSMPVTQPVGNFPVNEQQTPLQNSQMSQINPERPSITTSQVDRFNSVDHNSYTAPRTVQTVSEQPSELGNANIQRDLINDQRTSGPNPMSLPPAISEQPTFIEPSPVIEKSPLLPELIRAYNPPKNNTILAIDSRNVYRPPPPLIRAVRKPRRKAQNNHSQNSKTRTHIYQNQRVYNQTVYPTCVYGHNQSQQQPIPQPLSNDNTHFQRNIIQSQYCPSRQLEQMSYPQPPVEQVQQEQFQCQQTRQDQHRVPFPQVYTGTVEVAKYQVFNLKPGQERFQNFNDQYDRGPPQLTPIYSNAGCTTMQGNQEQYATNYHYC